MLGCPRPPEGEVAAMELVANRVSPLVSHPGRVVATRKHLYFQPFNVVSSSPVQIFELADIDAVMPRTFNLEPVGLEIFFKEMVRLRSGLSLDPSLLMTPRFVRSVPNGNLRATPKKKAGVSSKGWACVDAVCSEGASQQAPTPPDIRTTRHQQDALSVPGPLLGCNCSQSVEIHVVVVFGFCSGSSRVPPSEGTGLRRLS